MRYHDIMSVKRGLLMEKILIVEDEKPIRDLIRMNLSDAGYDCTCAVDGLDAANILENEQFDLVLLDIMLPKIDGYELFQYIKSLRIPVIFLTAKSGLTDRVKGLSMGAEDYIVKPFEIVELLARIHVVLRRFHKGDSTLIYGLLNIDLDNRIVHKGDALIELTPKEFELLVLFVQNVDITLFREQIYESVWGQEECGNTRTLDLHIQRLRKKAELFDHLKTIHKVGYRLERIP